MLRTSFWGFAAFVQKTKQSLPIKPGHNISPTIGEPLGVTFPTSPAVPRRAAHLVGRHNLTVQHAVPHRSINSLVVQHKRQKLIGDVPLLRVAECHPDPNARWQGCFSAAESTRNYIDAGAQPSSSITPDHWGYRHVQASCLSFYLRHHLFKKYTLHFQ